MNQSFIICLRIIAESLIEVEAMKAANEERKHRGESLAYGEDAFIRIQQHMIERVRNEVSYV